MSRIEFKLNTQNVKKEILQAEWMKSYIAQQAQSMAEADTHIKTFIGFDRAKSIIYPNTKEHGK